MEWVLSDPLHDTTSVWTSNWPKLLPGGSPMSRKKRRYTKYDITMTELVVCACIFGGIMSGLCVVVFAVAMAAADKLG
jgi:hypothetical protein